MVKRIWQEWGRELLIALLIALLIRAEVAEARRVPTPSMVPTIAPGDRILAEKLLYHFAGPKRGDVVIFTPPWMEESSFLEQMLGLHEDYLKRVIALPGETVEIRRGQVLINGQPLTEPYLNAPPTYVMAAVTVPEGKLFVLGDNRNHSFDSHYWGWLDMDSVQSRAVFRFWPLSRLGLVR